MGYHIRRIATCKPPTLAEIDSELLHSNPNLAVEHDGGLEGLVTAADVSVAEVEISLKGSEIFEEEIGEFLTLVTGHTGNVAQVVETLKSATCIVAIRVLFGGRNSEKVFDDLDPLFDWLNKNLTGLMHADGEGFYNGNKLILEA